MKQKEMRNASTIPIPQIMRGERSLAYLMHREHPTFIWLYLVFGQRDDRKPPIERGGSSSIEVIINIII